MPRTIAENLAEIHARMAEAALRGGRPPSAVRLVAVTKYAPLEAIEELLAAGCRDLGESRPQSLWERAPLFQDTSPPPNWHFIGQLQTNKIERTLPLVSLVHSLDRWKLAEALQAAAARQGRICQALIEVRLSDDPAKHGFWPEELPALLPRLANLPHLQIRGLMGMSGVNSTEAEIRRQFLGLADLREILQLTAPKNIQLAELSLGMTDDYEIGIECGATLVRIGSGLFAGTTHAPRE
ncbi:MAG: YggS family pyridoxal phosphate-dependent enzyme [Pirellulales bacterium]|nr:YggS family pyridoxal phosphate-dependent enzyme [Pirellulales bacterium]